ncbi:MAG: hypothetical protein WC979_02140 [Candidatus Pacearchaeota archaeon]|jgi:hypothetical protein|nr:hypothetical protein [Clostridia bacterium]
MYTTIITGVLTFILLACIFRKDHGDPNARFVSAIVFLIALILSNAIVTSIRLKSLKVKSEAVRIEGLEPIVVGADTVFYKCDTTIANNVTSISKVVAPKKKSNAYVIHKHYSFIKLIDSTQIAVKFKSEDDITKFAIDEFKFVFDTINMYQRWETNYIPDKWSAQIIPTIKEWKEIRIKESEFNKATKAFPGLLKIYKVTK